MQNVGEAVNHLLTKYWIPTHRWGQGDAKTIYDLIGEVTNRECTLHEEHGTLLRVTRVLGINVYYGDGHSLYVLKERMQVFTDGRIKRRNLDTSLGEKLRMDEWPLTAVYRALKEELDIEMDGEIPLIPKFPYFIGPRESKAYPGLRSMHIVYPFDVTLPAAFYKQEGYVEEQQDKTTYFGWDEIRFN